MSSLSHSDICHALFALRRELRADRALLEEVRESLKPDRIGEWEARIADQEAVAARFEAASKKAATYEAQPRIGR